MDVKKYGNATMKVVETYSRFIASVDRTMDSATDRDRRTAFYMDIATLREQFIHELADLQKALEAEV